jgi:PAS domain-containing protein
MRASQEHAGVARTANGKHNLLATGTGEDVAVLTLDERGTILDCSRAAETLFKYLRSEMVWQHVSLLLPQLANVDLMQNGEPNPGLRFLCRIGRLFRTVAQDGRSFPSELYFTVLFNDGCGRLLLIVRPKAEMADGESQLQLL